MVPTTQPLLVYDVISTPTRSSYGMASSSSHTYTIQPHDPASNQRKIIPAFFTTLSQLAVGQLFIRAYPHQHADYSYIPISGSEKDIFNAAFKLQSLNAHGILFVNISSFPFSVSLDHSWNDGHWVPFEIYLRAVKGISSEELSLIGSMNNLRV